ncbi:hypothetical protein [Kineococcus sp. SYSU DK005]|uniref:hypothetical protein n=1 Tax=Kineococcus sp. SYSU DK005 TaxID=3383126 RepID=UPI003D7DF052
MQHPPAPVPGGRGVQLVDLLSEERGVHRPPHTHLPHQVQERHDVHGAGGGSGGAAGSAPLTAKSVWCRLVR